MGGCDLMLENIAQIKEGNIIIDDRGEILYSSFACKHETNRILEGIRASHGVRNGVFEIEIYDNCKVSLKKVIIKEYIIYLIEVKDTHKNYGNTFELKILINETREKLNKLIALEQNHQNEVVLELSRELDILIYHYINLQLDLRS
jgi:hypothetical protein